MSAIVESVQHRLAQLGYDPGPIDGQEGPLTDGALASFKANHGMVARPAPLILTLPLLFSKEAKQWKARAVPEDKAIITAAKALIGLKEVPGAGSNQRIIDLARKGGISWYSDDATAWCAAFVNGILAETGHKTTKSALARSFMQYGEAVRWQDARPGDIFVMPRGTNPLYGHTGFIEKNHGDGTFGTVEANVSDAVVRRKRREGEFLENGIRRPVKA